MFWDERNRHVIRIGDTTTHGGKVLTGDERMPVMGKPVARIGDMVWCPKCLSANYVIIEGNNKMKTFGRQVAFEGDRTACGAMLISSLRNGSSPFTNATENENLTTAASDSTSTTDLVSNTRASKKALLHGVQFLLKDSKDRALVNMPYKVLHGNQVYATGTTDRMGRTQPLESDQSIDLHVQIDAQRVKRKKYPWA